MGKYVPPQLRLPQPRQELTRGQQVPEARPAAEEPKELSGSSPASVGNSPNGRQSRFKQDLTNLNKAVKKWLIQAERGELSHSAIEERIRTSPAAEHLRRKPDFRAD